MNEQLANYNLILNAIKTNNSTLHSVICTETGRVLCLTNTYRTAFSLSTIQNTKLWKNLHLTHKIPAKINPNLPQQFVYNILSQSFEQQGLEDAEWYKYVIISEKAACLDQLFRLLPDNEEPVYDTEDQLLIDLHAARLSESERMRKKYIRQILMCETLKEVNMIYDEMNREAHAYGNF
jgi:hypothetical protein